MDPHQKQLSQLDPKLKEAYERVMGGTSPQNSPVQPIQQPAPTTPPVPDLPHAVSPENAVTSEKVVITTPHPSTTMFTATPPQPANPGTVHIGYGAKPGIKTQKVNFEKKKLHIHPALYIAGCIAFFILYTVFWIKVFNLPIPFLP